MAELNQSPMQAHLCIRVCMCPHLGGGSQRVWSTGSPQRRKHAGPSAAWHRAPTYCYGENK